MISLPLFPEVDDDDVRGVIRAIERVARYRD
jgi:dTDP-4-amino-4,6-dideoxygalactose transaminase